MTDRVSFYYVSDVFVVERLRGRGLGKFLLTTAIGRPGIAESSHGFLLTGSERTERLYVELLQFRTIHRKSSVFRDGERRTLYYMLRPPGPLLAPTKGARLAHPRGGAVLAAVGGLAAFAAGWLMRSSR